MAEAPEEAPTTPHDHGGLYRKSEGFNPVQALRSAIQNFPWLMIAVGVHVVIGAAFAVWKLGHSNENKEDTAIITTAGMHRRTPIAPRPTPPVAGSAHGCVRNEDERVKAVFYPKDEKSNTAARPSQSAPGTCSN